jgi:hypothetical protein
VRPGDDRGNAREDVRQQLRATPGCIATDRFAEPLTAAEREHLATCARCDAEFTLWHEFSDPKPSPEEDAAVEWVIGELGRRRAQSQKAKARTAARSWLTVLRRPTIGAAAAAISFVVAAWYVTWDPEPELREPQAVEQTYRTERLEVMAPLGDLQTAPGEIAWVALAGAARYDVEVLEIDGTVLWRGSSQSPQVSLPATLVAQLVPGKTVLWEVTARDAAGAPLATSGTQRFRVNNRSPERN